MLPVCTPVALVRAGIGIKHDNAVVEVSISHKHLVGFPNEKQARRASNVFGVVAAPVLSRMPDLHEKLSLVCELEDLVIRLRASAQPHVVLVVDEDGVLGSKPFVSRSRAA